MTEEKSDTQAVTEALYKQNLELAVKNKTLSLLRKLYQISILVLEPNDLAKKLTEALQAELELEFVGIFQLDEKNTTLTPLGVSASQKLVQADSHTVSLFSATTVSVLDNRLLASTINLKTPTVLDSLKTLWGATIPAPLIDGLVKAGNIKDTLIASLFIDGKTEGVLVMAMNRGYDSFTQFEKEAVESYVNVIAVALDKAAAYQKIATLNTELGTANEKLKDLDKLKTEFVSLASHQLRSPLTSIKGYSSMLLEGSYGALTDAKQKEAIDRIFQSSVHLANVVEDLLSVSKIEQGGMQYTMAAFDVSKATGDLVADLTIPAQKKGLTLEYKPDTSKQVMLIGDMEKLRQVILNLVDNAIKYTKTGGITVGLALLNDEEKHMRISVKDTGMGVSTDYKEKVFQKFERGEAGKMNTTGSGLGLYLAKKIVEAHKGKIWLDSEGEGKGTTFWIELPGAKTTI